MEDHKQSRTQPGANKEEKILDLTKDMELADQEKHKIFDLTEGTDQPEVLRQQEPPSSPSPSPTDNVAKESTPPISDAPLEDPAPAIAADAAPQPDPTRHSEDPTPEDKNDFISDESPVADPAPPEEIVEPQVADSDLETEDQTDEPELTLDETVSMPDAPESADAGEEIYTIEDEVDAAFDEVQSEHPPTETQEKTNDQLFDKLSGITQMVDDAVREINQDDSPQDAPPESVDDATFTSDAAELEAIISGEDEEDDIIELTDIVDPAETMATSELEESDEDDIIELFDIVDPAELEAVAKEAVSDTNDIETADQTDLEFAATDILDQDTAPEPTAVPGADDPPALSEEELALSDLDDLDQDDELDKDLDEQDDFDTIEIDKLFGDDDFLGEEETTEDGEPSLDQNAEDEEQVILLTDVLKEGTNAKRPPAAELKEEDTAGERLSKDTDVEADTPPSVSSPPNAKELEDLSNLSIEAAVEHLLKTKYADTIQQMVADAVEKAVTREVENFKQGLSDKDEPKT